MCKSSYRRKVQETLGRIADEIVDILFLVDEAVVPSEANVCGDIPCDCRGGEQPITLYVQQTYNNLATHL